MRSVVRRVGKIFGTVLCFCLALPALIITDAAGTHAAQRRAGTSARKTAARRTSKPQPQPATTTARAQPVRVSQFQAQPQATPAPQQTPQRQTPAASPTPAPAPAPQSSPAQREQPPPGETVEDDEVYRVNSTLVVVPTSVTDAQGQPVQGLKAADFRLEEEGRAQEIAQVGDAEQVPLDIAVIFDVSSSVSQKNFFAFQQQAAASFLKQVLKPADRAAVISISDKPSLVQGLAPAQVATAKVTSIPAATTPVPTAFYDTVSFAAKYLAENAPGRHRRVILVISDGDDNFSDRVREQTVAEYEAQRKAEAAGGNGQQAVRTAARRDLQSRHARAVQAVQRDVQRADAVFYSINPGGPSVRLNEISSRAQSGMQQLAESTGGTAYMPDRAEDLERIFRQIAAELRAQYLLQYYSNSNAPNGKFLRIKVGTTARPDLRVRARQGYYVRK